MLKFSRTIDPVALIALLIASVTGFNQAREYLSPAEVRQFAPKTITLYFADFGSGLKYLSVIAHSTYTNTGGRNTLAYIVDEAVEFRLGASIYTLHWGDIVNFATDQGRMELSKTADASAFPIPYGSVVSRSLRLYPYPIECQDSSDCDRYQQFIDKREFVAALQLGAEIEFKITGELSDGSVLAQSCRVQIDDSIFSNLALQDWFIAACAQPN